MKHGPRRGRVAPLLVTAAVSAAVLITATGTASAATMNAASAKTANPATALGAASPRGTGTAHRSAPLTAVELASFSRASRQAARTASGGQCEPTTASSGICEHAITDPAAVAKALSSLSTQARHERNVALVQPPAPPAQCEFSTGHYVPNPGRFTSCKDTVWELYTYVIIAGVIHITGSMNLEDLQWNSYVVNSLNWTHGLVLNAYPGASGTLENGATATVASMCDTSSICQVVRNLGPKDTTLADLTPGSSLHDGWIEKDTGGAASGPGKVDVQGALGIFLNGPGASGIPPWTFQDTKLTGRCDSVTGGNVGCVNQAFVATLAVSLASYGSAAAIIQWAQKNLSGHWGARGSGQPLHRLLDAALQDKNRTIICGKSVFTADKALNKALKPYGDEDSCDEFPFASSYESGAMTTDVNGKPKPHVTSGKDCAQVIAVQTGHSGKEAKDWTAVKTIGTPSGTEPCVRGHIPLKLNSRVGTAYLNAIKGFRLVAKDPFWLSVTK